MSQPANTVELTVRLHELCELLHVSVHRPRMTFKIKNAKVTTANGEELDNQKATSPAWKLMPAEMSRELDQLEGQVSRFLDQYAERFRAGARADDSDEPHGAVIKGLHLVPQAHVETLLGHLHRIDEEMRAVVTHWTQDSERFRAAVRSRLNSDALWEQAKALIPSLGSLLGSTRVDIVSIPFGLAMGQLRRAGERSFLQQARARTGEMVEQVMHQVIAGPRQELADAVTNMAELIARDGNVSVRTVAPIRRAIEKLQVFDFVADDVLRARLADLSNMLDGVVPAEQNSVSAAANGLSNLLANVAAAALDNVALANQYQATTARRPILIRRPAAVG